MNEDEYITLSELYDLLDRTVGSDHAILKGGSDFFQIKVLPEHVAPILKEHHLVLQRLPGCWSIHMEKKVEVKLKEAK